MAQRLPTAAALGVAALLLPAAARAAACCVSASVFGAGRLVAWEEAAAGLQTSYAAGTGQWDASGRFFAPGEGERDDEARAEAFGLFRLAERWQAFARVPWVVGLRAAGPGAESVGHGLGDVQAGARWEALSIGEYAELPGVTLLGTVLSPTGRRPEDAADPLGASATGRGAWALSLAAAAERTHLPWFWRLDLGGTVSLPFERRDTGALQAYGPALQAALSGGRELWSEGPVLGLQLLFEREWPLSLDGSEVPESGSMGLTTSLSAAWKPSAHWTLTAALGTGVGGRLGLGRNRPERLSLGLGVRHGWF